MAQDYMVWMDLEMTGLDFANDVIIEIATIVTDKNLEEIAEGPNLAIYQEDTVLDKMDAWCKSHHTESGLVDRIKQSSITMEQAQEDTLNFLRKWVEPNTAPLCGNSICTDRRFLAKDMPKLDEFLHYRQIDVSTIKELAKRWRPDLYQENKNSSHLALADIRDSINELRYYRDNFFR
jgi:oligoribonuclease